MPSDIEYRLQPLHEKISIPETEETWDSIAKAIATLTTLIQQEGAEYPTELTQTLRSLSRPLNSAAVSERTRLSGAALELIRISAESLGRPFTALIPLYFPTLLTLCTRPNKVVLSRAKACVICIIKFTQAPTILTYLAESAKDKSVSLRLAAAESAVVCLNCFNPPDLEKEARAREIEGLIRSTATDASADVRKVGRKIFDAYKILLPNRVDTFTAPLTPTIKKYLDLRSKAPSAPRSNPPSRPPSSQSTHSINSNQPLTRPRSVISSSSSINHLSRSASSYNGEIQGHARTNSGVSLTHSESAPNVGKLNSSQSSTASTGRPAVGPSRPRAVMAQRGPMRGEMLPPQSLPVRPPSSPSSSTASDYLAESAMSSTKSNGPIRQLIGPSRMPKDEFQDPPPKPRVVGGARRVLLPDPAILNQNQNAAHAGKPPTRPGPGRSTTAPPISTRTQSQKPVALHTAAARPAVQQQKSEPIKPRILPSTSSRSRTTSGTSSSSRTGAVSKTEVSIPPAVTVRHRPTGSSRLTEPTQSQLAKAKAIKATASKKEVAKPVISRSTAVKGTAPVKTGLVGKDKTNLPRGGRGKTPVPVPETVIEVAKTIPLPPSPKVEHLPVPPVEEPVVEPPAPASEARESEMKAVEPPELESQSISGPETAIAEEPDEAKEAEDFSENTTPRRQPIEDEEDADVTPRPSSSGEEEEYDEDTLREATDEVQDLPQIFHAGPSTPETRSTAVQIVPETPISSLLSSIQAGFDFTPAPPPFDPDRTVTFGGLLPLEKMNYKPLFVGYKKRR